MLDLMEMSAGALHQWLNARRAAEGRERAELRATCATLRESLHQALPLIAFASRLHGWPRRAWAAMLLDRGATGDAARARELIAAGLAEAEALGMAREVVRLQRLLQRF
jgi:hypothetical protein